MPRAEQARQRTGDSRNLNRVQVSDPDGERPEN